MNLTVLCGPADPCVSILRPPVFEGVGYSLSSGPSVVTVSGRDGAEVALNRAAFTAPAKSDDDLIRVHWGWSTDGRWDAPANPRLVYRGHAALYKIYVVDRMNSRGPDLAQAEAFLHDALAVIQNALRESPPTRSGSLHRGRSGSLHGGEYMTVHRESQTSRTATTWTATPRTAGVSPATKGRTGRRVLNLRAAVILGVIMFGALFALDRLHSRQYSLTREFIRQRGLTAAKEGKFSAAAVHMEQYLAMRPGDVEIRAQLSEILVDHVGRKPHCSERFG